MMDKLTADSHYHAMESYFFESIQKGSDFLFDSKKFEEEMTRLWELHEIPVDVRVYRLPLSVTYS